MLSQHCPSAVPVSTSCYCTRREVLTSHFSLTRPLLYCVTPGPCYTRRLDLVIQWQGQSCDNRSSWALSESKQWLDLSFYAVIRGVPNSTSSLLVRSTIIGVANGVIAVTNPGLSLIGCRKRNRSLELVYKLGRSTGYMRKSLFRRNTKG